MWWGVDPLAGEMPAWSPYAYTFQNPVRYIDPTGMIPEEGDEPPGEMIWHKQFSHGNMYQYDDGNYYWANTNSDGGADWQMWDGSQWNYHSTDNLNSKEVHGLGEYAGGVRDLSVTAISTAMLAVGGGGPGGRMLSGNRGLVAQSVKSLGLLDDAAKAGLQLENSVANVMGNTYKAMGEVTVPIKNTELLKSLNATSKGDWVKVYEAGIQNGTKIETHYFRNSTTGQVFNVKPKYNYWHQKAFKNIGQ